MANQQIQPWVLMDQPQFSPQDLIVNPQYGNQVNQMANPPMSELKNKTQEYGGLPAYPETIKQPSIQDQLSLAYSQQQEMQNEAIKQAEEQLAAARSKPQEMDLSPLIALSDAWSQRPSGLLQAYKRPTDQSKNVQALQEAVLKARGGASELARMRAKDVAQLSQQDEQMRINQEIKRAQISALGQQREGKQDLSAQKFQRESEKEYTKTYGEPLRNLSIFGGKVTALEKKLTEKGDPFWGIDSSEIDALSSSINTDYNRDIAQLGALAGADLELIKSATGQGLGVKEYVMRQLKGGPQSRVSLLRMLKSDVEKRATAYKNEVTSNSDYQFVSKRLDNDLRSIDKAMGTNISGAGNQQAAPTQFSPNQLNKMSTEELRAAARAKAAAEGGK